MIVVRCANCGSGDIRMEENYVGYGVCCDSCYDYDSFLAWGKTKEEAAEEWNEHNYIVSFEEEEEYEQEPDSIESLGLQGYFSIG